MPTGKRQEFYLQAAACKFYFRFRESFINPCRDSFYFCSAKFWRKIEKRFSLINLRKDARFFAWQSPPRFPLKILYGTTRVSFLFLILRHIYGCTFVLFASIRLQVLFSLSRKFYESLSGFVLFLLRKSFGGKSKDDFLWLIYGRTRRSFPTGALFLGVAIAAPFPVWFGKSRKNGAPSRHALRVISPFRLHLDSRKSPPINAKKITPWFSLRNFCILHFAFCIQKNSVDRFRFSQNPANPCKCSKLFLRSTDFWLDFWGVLLYNSLTDVANAIVAHYLRGIATNSHTWIRSMHPWYPGRTLPMRYYYFCCFPPNLMSHIT